MHRDFYEEGIQAVYISAANVEFGNKAAWGLYWGKEHGNNCSGIICSHHQYAAHLHAIEKAINQALIMRKRSLIIYLGSKHLVKALEFTFYGWLGENISNALDIIHKNPAIFFQINRKREQICIHFRSKGHREGEISANALVVNALNGNIVQTVYNFKDRSSFIHSIVAKTME